MDLEVNSAGLAERERTGSEKRCIGIKHVERMLPKWTFSDSHGDLLSNCFAPDIVLMATEDAYCDMWNRTEIIDSRTRSIFTVSMMISVGNVGNQFELEFHVPGAIRNGVTIDEIQAILTHSTNYVGAPANARAMKTSILSLTELGMLEAPHSSADLQRREQRGSQKREIGRQVLREMDPKSSLLSLSDEKLDQDSFAPELDYMILENVYFDSWARKDLLSLRDRCVVTLGLLMGLANQTELAEHIPCALRNGITVSEMTEFVYQAAVYLGYPAAKPIRTTLNTALRTAGAI
jgi:4-carboxymuconolactone decarboxylase